MSERIDLPVRFGPFVLLRALGSGGMGTGYLARHPDWPSNLVVKRMHAHFLDDREAFKRFVHEAQIATYVRQANVATLMAVGTVGREPFFATEHVFGMPVSELVARIEEKKTAHIPLAIGLYLALDLLKGLEAIHEARDTETGEALGLIHRDIGARNILVGFDGCLRIIDLGLGKSLLADWQTAANVIAGSPDYMPPEQALGERVDRRADVYAAAVTIWEILVGRKRIAEKYVAQRIAAALAARPERLLGLVPPASEALEAALMQAMAPEADQRTPDARLLREAIETELGRLGHEVHRRDVAKWLDSACATAIAKQRRELDEALARVGEAQEEPGQETQIFAAQPVVFVPTSPRTRRPDSHLEQLAKRKAPAGLGEAILGGWSQGTEAFSARFEAWSSTFSRTPTAFRLGILALFTSALVVLSLMVYAKVRTSAQPAVAPLASTRVEPPPPPPAPLAPVEATPPLVAPPPAAESDPPPAELVPLPTPADPQEARKEIKPAAGVRAKKQDLVSRLKNLRKTRFDVGWQKQLNLLGQRLTAARTLADLSEVEAGIAKLERAP